MALNQRQIAFAKEYIVDFNASGAAKRAGYSEKTAYQIASNLLRNIKIQQEIERQIKERNKRTYINADRVIYELSKIAFADVRRNSPVKASDKVKSLELLLKHTGAEEFESLQDQASPEDARAEAIAILKEASGDNILLELRKIGFGAQKETDQLKALDMMCKLLDLYDEDKDTEYKLIIDKRVLDGSEGN